MKHKSFNVEQIVAVLKQAEAGIPLAELIRRVEISEQTFYRWKKQYVRLEVDQVRQLKQLQEESTAWAKNLEWHPARRSMSPYPRTTWSFGDSMLFSEQCLLA